jgi:hypothetical protein
MNFRLLLPVLACLPLIVADLKAQSAALLPAPQECVQKFTDKTWCASRADLRGFLELDHPEYAGGPKARYRAESFSEVIVLWSSTTEALLLANAMPATKATPTVLSSLILVKQVAGGWSVGHSMTFLASGKYSAAKAAPAEEGAAAVVTLTLTQGGRGNAYSQSETFKVEDHRIQRVPLPTP